MIALDTNYWIWFHLGSERIPRQIVEQIDTSTVLSSASVWEVMVLFQKGRLASPMTAEQTVREWLKSAPMRVVPPNEEIKILSRTLRFEHDDPADRFIGATAFHVGVPLATADKRLLELGWLATL